MELTPGIHSLHVPMTGEFFVRAFPPNVYLVMDGEGVFIDTGYNADDAVDQRLDYLKSIGSPSISHIILTHPHVDHLGGAERFKKVTGAKILIHADDADVANEEFEDTRVDETFKGGEVVRVGSTELELIHTPGHTHGHTCVLKRDDRALFTGDHILGTGTTAVSPDRGDMARYMDSLRKLQGLEISALYPGHGQPVKEPQRKIKELIDHRMEREKQVIALLSDGVDDIEGMVKAIYPELNKDLLDSARGQVKVHLVKLEREGKVETRNDGESYVLK